MNNFIAEAIEHVGQVGYHEGYKECLTQVSNIIEDSITDTSIVTVVDAFNNVTEFVNTNLSTYSETEVI